MIGDKGNISFGGFTGRIIKEGLITQVHIPIANPVPHKKATCSKEEYERVVKNGWWLK